MRPGDIITTTYIRATFNNGKAWAGYKASKDENFVFIFLGTEKRDGSNQMDILQTMRNMGWDTDHPELFEVQEGIEGEGEDE